MKKIIIPIVLIVVLVGGYFIYQAFFTYEPSYRSTFTRPEHTPSPAPFSSEVASAGDKFSKWVGDWVPEEGFDPNEPFYLHVQLDASNLPTFEIKVMEGYQKTRALPVLKLIEPLDGSSVKYKFESPDMPEELSMETILAHNPATDKIEWKGIVYRNGQKVAQEEVVELFLIRKELGQLASDSIRLKVQRVKADMRSMAVAIESYFVDNNRYPAWVPGNHPLAFNKAPAPQNMPSFRLGEHKAGAIIPFTLTTPISYITKYPNDPFQVSTTGLQPTFAYYADKSGWILVSPGPDSDYDINPQKDYRSDIRQPSPQLLLKAYDPSNGTISDGDIFRVKQ